jgi:hypothetical protein
MINVGTDGWGYRPVSKVQIGELITEDPPDRTQSPTEQSEETISDLTAPRVGSSTGDHSHVVPRSEPSAYTCSGPALPGGT